MSCILTQSTTQVTKISQMAINYVKGWFIIDISSSVPAETAITIATAMDTFPTIRLDERTCLGAARLKMLRDQLCDIG